MKRRIYPETPFENLPRNTQIHMATRAYLEEIWGAVVLGQGPIETVDGRQEFDVEIGYPLDEGPNRLKQDFDLGTLHGAIAHMHAKMSGTQELRI